jgi:hypothetical protein
VSSDEIRPQAKPSPLRRLFGKKDDASTTFEVGGRAPKTTETKPGKPRAGRRVSTADTLADIWKGGGGLLVRSGTHIPSGRWMQFQAPYAGEMLDEALAGSVLDKVALQRIAKARGRFDLIGAVLGPPLVLMAIERNPQNGQVLLPLLESSIRASLPHMVEGIKKVKAKEKVTAEAAAALFSEDPEYDGTQDPVSYIMQMLFDGWVAPVGEAPPPTPEDAVA